jgi:porin
MKSIKLYLIIFLMLVFQILAFGKDNSLLEIIERDHMLGNLNEGRDYLEDHGLTFDLVYTADGFMNTRGGINTDDSEEYRGDISLYVELDTSKAELWEGGTFFLHLQEEHGYGITREHVGDYQVLDNIDADDFKQVSEFWYRHSIYEDLFWLKLGKMEATCDFGGSTCKYMGMEFINSSAGLIPTVPMPSSPNQDWGVVLGFNPNKWFSINTGVYEGRNDGGRSIRHTTENLYGPMVLVEPAFHGQIADRKSDFFLGGWWNGDRIENFEFVEEDEDTWTFTENYGWYLIWNLEIWKEETKDEEGFEGVGLFTQYGWNLNDRNDVDVYYGGGFNWTGAIPTRNDDVLGLGAFNVNFSDKAEFEKEFETAIELFYKGQITGWMWLKPDFQYIINPGGTDNKDALAAGLRLEISF